MSNNRPILRSPVLRLAFRTAASAGCLAVLALPSLTRPALAQTVAQGGAQDAGQGATSGVAPTPEVLPAIGSKHGALPKVVTPAAGSSTTDSTTSGPTVSGAASTTTVTATPLPANQATVTGTGMVAKDAHRAGSAHAAATARKDDRPEAPVTFTADQVEYDREKGEVTARGNVEAWQNHRILRADEFTYNRNTGVATLRGHVQLLQADGQTLFADEAELSNEFRDGVLKGLRGWLSGNGKIAANGARRTNGTITDMARVVYSSCDLCKSDPTAPPLWEIRARYATQDRDADRIRYQGATMRLGGVPMFYLPYFSQPDPSTPRVSGFMFPSMGYTHYMGAFAQTPYYWAIDKSTDMLISPIISSRQDPNLGLEFRKKFNNGEIQASGSIGGFDDQDDNYKHTLGGHIYTKGVFNLDEHWRAGFDINRAASQDYLRTFRYESRRILASTAYLEGFWDTQGYVRIDTRAYQGLRPEDDTRLIPYVAPNIYGEWSPRQRIFGGRLTTDFNTYGLYRTIGSHTERVAWRTYWERPLYTASGDIFTLKTQTVVRAYNAGGLGDAPTYLPDANGNQAVGNVRMAVDWRKPFVRSAGAYGTQTIEPHVQLVTGPNTGAQTRQPNEDSLDTEFTDANLFSLNRFSGLDRQEGGTRVDAALRGAWDFPNGGQVEALVGRSYRLHKDATFAYNSGLEKNFSDYVARLRIAPTPWLSLIGHTRLDGDDFQERYLDTSANLTVGRTTYSAGYVHTPVEYYLTPPAARNEVSGGISTRINEHWRASGLVRYDVVNNRPAIIQGTIGYEDECFILQGRFLKRYAVDPTTSEQYAGNTMLLIQVSFKTMGNFFFRAL